MRVSERAVGRPLEGGRRPHWQLAASRSGVAFARRSACATHSVDPMHRMSEYAVKEDTTKPGLRMASQPSANPGMANTLKGIRQHRFTHSMHCHHTGFAYSRGSTVRAHR